LSSIIADTLRYRWRPIRNAPKAIIVLGSGLIGGEVPPLLAARLDRGIAVHRDFNDAPVIIPSGGQGSDEPRPEGMAMREYLLDNGISRDRKSTRLNSSHVSISYAVFCLKKKK